MKKIIGFVLLSSILACTGIGGSYKINGEIAGLPDGTKVIFEKQTEKGVEALDTVRIEKGKFTMKGTAKEPFMVNARFENLNTGFSFVAEGGTIKVVGNKDSLQKIKLSGTSNNNELNIFNNRATAMRKKMEKFQNDNKTLIEAMQKNNDTVLKNKLGKEFEKFNTQFITENEKYIETHPKSLLSVLMIEGMMFQFEPNYDKIRKFYDGLDPEVKKYKPGRNIKIKLDALNTVKIGQKAPDFIAPNPDGKSISLNESLGKVTVIDFWASWCEPCRKKSPEFVALYNEFHKKGLNFIGVALEKKGERIQWKEAIAKDKLNWIHVSNLQFWQDPIAKKYAVDGIPATFLIDKNGIIVAKNLNSTELKAKIVELLAK